MPQKPPGLASFLAALFVSAFVAGCFALGYAIVAAGERMVKP